MGHRVGELVELDGPKRRRVIAGAEVATELARDWWSVAIFLKSRSGFTDLSAELEMLQRK